MKTLGKRLVVVTISLLLTACATSPRSNTKAGSRAPMSERVELTSHAWQLVGDWLAPKTNLPVPAVLLLHQAAGSRAEYTELASALASRGIASLRLDLRGHFPIPNMGGQKNDAVPLFVRSQVMLLSNNGSFLPKIFMAHSRIIDHFRQRFAKISKCQA